MEKLKKSLLDELKKNGVFDPKGDEGISSICKQLKKEGWVKTVLSETSDVPIMVFPSSIFAAMYKREFGE